MRAVFKYPLPLADRSMVEMPVTAEILSIGAQGSALQIWAKVDTAFSMTRDREFIITGTGHELPHRDRHVLVHRATVQADRFVWHVWQFEPLGERGNG